MFPMDRKPVPATVEYDAKGGRTTKSFSDAFAARRFYTSMLKQGRNPKVVRSETMTESTTTVAASTAPKAKAPKAPKSANTTKAKGKTPKAKVKASKPAPKAKAADAVNHGTERSHDLPWSAKKVAVFTALKSLKAVGQGGAALTSDIAAKANLTARDVRHYCYHAKAAGLIDVAEVAGSRGYGFYLTTKGAKVNPAAELKAQQAAKAK